MLQHWLLFIWLSWPPKRQRQKKIQCASMSFDWDKNCHIQCHVTVTWHSRTGSSMNVTTLALIYLTFLIPNTKKNNCFSICTSCKKIPWRDYFDFKIPDVIKCHVMTSHWWICQKFLRNIQDMPLLEEYLKFRYDIMFPREVIHVYIPLGSQKTPLHWLRVKRVTAQRFIVV